MAITETEAEKNRVVGFSEFDQFNGEADETLVSEIDLAPQEMAITETGDKETGENVEMEELVF